MSVAISEPQVEFEKKLFYKINEVSRITGLKPYVLRYWETEFPQLNPEKDENDQRRYRIKDIELVFKIKQLLYEEKFTIAGAKQRIASDAAAATRRPAGRPKAVIAAAPIAVSAPERIPARPASRTREVARPVRSIASLLKELSAIRGELRDLLSYMG